MKQVIVNEYLTVLEARHRNLDQAVARLDRRAHLTPSEQREVTDLKKERLLTRDRIETIRRSEPPPRIE